MTENETRAVLQAVDLVNKSPERYRPAFRDDAEWRSLQRGAAKLQGSLPAKGGRR